jgi:hypothetical protein
VVQQLLGLEVFDASRTGCVRCIKDRQGE